MKKIFSLVLVVLIATTSVFAYVEEYWNAGDVEDILFDGSHVIFDSKWGDPAIGITYAQESWSVMGGVHGFKLKMDGGTPTDMYLGATLGGSYRSENVRLGGLVNFRALKNHDNAAERQNLEIGVAGSFLQNKIRFAVPLVFHFVDGKVALKQVSPAYVKFVINAGTLSFLRFRVNYTDNDVFKSAADKGQALDFQLDGNFYQDYAERFGIETLVRLGYKTEIGLPAGKEAIQKPYLYVEPYIFGYNDGNTIQLGLVPFATVGAEFTGKTWGIDEYGLEIRTEFQPVKNLRARVSVQTVNQDGWAVKWNCRAAWYY